MPGTYNYPFEVGLPINLPTSFNGTYGNISYMAKVVLDVKSDWFDKKFETRFTVIKASDLNAVPRLRVIFSLFTFFSWSSVNLLFDFLGTMHK